MKHCWKVMFWAFVAGHFVNCGVLTDEVAFGPVEIVATPTNALTYQLGSQPLPKLQLKVRRDNFNPLSNVTVTFTTSHPGLLLAASTATTNDQGVAAMPLQQIIVPPGTYTIVSQLADGTSLTTPITITAGPPNSLTILESGHASICNSMVAGATIINDPLIIELRDALGYPIADTLILFTPSSSLINLSPHSDITDATGHAATQLMIGAVAQLTPLTLEISTANNGNLSLTCPITIMP